MVYGVHSFEVAAIGEFLVRQGNSLRWLEKLRDREEVFRSLRREITRDSQESADDWEHRVAIAFFAQDHPCVFVLQDGSCAIHALRPYACRRFFSLSDPGLCTATGIEDDAYRGLVIEASERSDRLLGDCDSAFGFAAETDRLDLGLLRWFESRTARLESGNSRQTRPSPRTT